jgi:hypothetical protein
LCDVDVSDEFVVTAAEVLDERVPGNRFCPHDEILRLLLLACTVIVADPPHRIDPADPAAARHGSLPPL